MNVELLLAYLGMFVVGSIVGSFLNVVVYRLPSVARAHIKPNATQSIFYLAWPLSFCPHCSEAIKPWNNIPLISYLVLRGRSPCCGKPIAGRYFVLELLGAVVPLICLARFGWSFHMVCASVLGWALLAVCWIDAQRFVLPDVIVLPLLWLGLAINLTATGFVPLSSAVLGAIGGYLALFTVSEGSELIMHRRMLGAGDPKLFAALGAWLGWELLPHVLILAAITASVYGIGSQLLRSRQLKAGRPIAFGPHLGLAGFVVLNFAFLFMQWGFWVP